MTRLMIIHFKGEEEVKWDPQVTGLDNSVMVVSLIKLGVVTGGEMGCGKLGKAQF